MDPGPRNATVTALTDLDVLIIGPREFSAMSDIPGFRGALFRSMAQPAADRSRPAWPPLLDAQESERGGPTGPLDVGDLRPFDAAPFRRAPNRPSQRVP